MIYILLLIIIGLLGAWPLAIGLFVGWLALVIIGWLIGD